MSTQRLVGKHCQPCEGETAALPPASVAEHLLQLKGWSLAHEGQKIRKEWVVKDFKSGIEFFNRVAEVAENEGHHPDLKLAGYRNVAIEIFTHAVGGLTENDFILAAKIDQLPIELKRK